MRRSGLCHAAGDWTSHPESSFALHHRPDIRGHATPLLCPHCCWLCAAAIVWRAHFFPYCVFFSLTCSVISRVFAQFQAEGTAESLENWIRRRPLLSDCSFLTSCYTPPGSQHALYALTQYENLGIVFSNIPWVWLGRVIPKTLDRLLLFCSGMPNHGVVSTPVALKNTNTLQWNYIDFSELKSCTALKEK